MNITIVTGLFNIGRDKWNYWSRDFNFYLKCFKNTLSLKSKMVIYCENNLFDFVKNERLLVDNKLQNTTIITKNAYDLEFFKYFEQINKVMNNHLFKNACRDKTVSEINYPLYNVVIFSKISLICEAAKINPYNSEYFIWIDAGVMHDKFVYNNMEFPNPNKINLLNCDKIYIACRKEPLENDLNLHNFLTSSSNRLVANVIGANYNNALFLNNFLHEFMNYMINNNLMESEQSAIAIAYLKNKIQINT